MPTPPEPRASGEPAPAPASAPGLAWALAAAAATGEPEPGGAARRVTPSEPTRLDLTEALRDGYLRRVLAGPQGEPVEVGIHRMRLYLPPDAPDAARLVGLRMRGVLGAAAQAHRKEVDGERVNWVSDPGDWVASLDYEEALPPVVTACVLGSERTLVRLNDASDDLYWIAGTPLDLDAFRRAPILLELSAEGVLGSGAEARMRLFVAALAIEVRDASGVTTLEQVAADGAAFLERWQAHRERRRVDPDVGEDLQLEWLQPPADDDDDDDEPAEEGEGDGSSDHGDAPAQDDEGAEAFAFEDPFEELRARLERQRGLP